MRGETEARLAFALVVRTSNDAAAVLSTLRELQLPAGPSPVVETNKPGVDATILRELQERFAVNDPASECVLIDAGPGSTDAALPPGLPKLLLEETGADGMSGWPAMLLKIARKTGRNAAENLQLVLPVLAAAEGVVDLQQVSFRPERIEAEGHCLISVEDSALGALSGLFLNLPTSFVIEQPDSPHPVAFKEVAEDTIQEQRPTFKVCGPMASLRWHQVRQAKLKQESWKAWRRHCSVNQRTMSKLMRPAGAYFGEGASTDQVHRKALAVPGRA